MRGAFLGFIAHQPPHFRWKTRPTLQWPPLPEGFSEGELEASYAPGVGSGPSAGDPGLLTGRLALTSWALPTLYCQPGAYLSFEERHTVFLSSWPLLPQP